MTEDELKSFAANLLNGVIVEMMTLPGITKAIDKLKGGQWATMLDEMRDDVAERLRNVIPVTGDK